MNWQNEMNNAINYIEANITKKIDYSKAASIACCSLSRFQNIFMFFTGITPLEYVRKRRMALSAGELINSNIKIIDLSFKYGYDSPEAFTRSFKAFHGVSPSAARKLSQYIDYPPISFQIKVIGGHFSMETKLERIEFINIPNVRIIGREITVRSKKDTPALWEQVIHDGTINMLRKFPRAISDCIIGWMGDANGKTYNLIAGVIAEENTPVPDGMQYRDLPACDVAKGFLNGHKNAHNLTVKEIVANGFQPDYSFGWSAEVYPDFDETGTVYYFCPYKK